MLVACTCVQESMIRSNLKFPASAVDVTRIIYIFTLGNAMAYQAQKARGVFFGDGSAMTG